MENRHPVDELLGSEFPEICNHCVVMADWSRKTLKFCEKFCLKNTTPYAKIFKNSLPKVFIATAIDVVVFKCRKIRPTGNRWNRASLVDQKQNFGCLLNCRYCADRAKNLPGPAPNNVLRVLQISSTVHFRRSYSRTREHHQIAP